MKIFNSKKLLVMMFFALTTMYVKGKNPSEKIIAGAYGVCNSDAQSSTKIELTINEDFTFHYYDNYNKSKIIDIKGNWTLQESTILLKDFKSNFSIHDKWTIDKNSKCIKSRKGLEWTRLCNIKSCN